MLLRIVSVEKLPLYSPRCWAVEYNTGEKVFLTESGIKELSKDSANDLILLIDLSLWELREELNKGVWGESLENILDLKQFVQEYLVSCGGVDKVSAFIDQLYEAIPTYNRNKSFRGIPIREFSHSTLEKLAILLLNENKGGFLQ